MEYINHNEHCCICGGGAELILQLPFCDIIGMAEEYTQFVRVCPRCGFAYTDNPFSEERLNNRYANMSKFEFDSDDYVLSESDSYVKRCLRQKFFIENAVGKFDSMLEVGAASGYNISLYNDCCDCIGIEPSEKNCILAERNYGIKMFNGMFADFIKSCDRQFDMIFLSHVLEHIVNPFDFIMECSKINSKYVFIEVPSFDFKFKDEPFGMFAEEHVNYFTTEGLTSLMNMAGYSLVDEHMIFGNDEMLPAGWPAISTIWQKSDKKAFLHPVFDTKTLMSCYIKDSYVRLSELEEKISEITSDMKVAVWGTGHHASMLLANTTLGNKNVVKFYDSDVRKHKMTMFGKSISSFDESDIYEGRVDCILVATYTAQRPISKILERYRNDCKVVLLYEI